MTRNNNNAGWKFEHSYERLPSTFFSKVNPTSVRAPRVVVLNGDLVNSLGLTESALSGEEGAHILAGNKIPEGASPIAQAYAGHQFGHFTMLGDGRAIMLGEHITPSGERFDIQLKGSGITPYSRMGDGRAVLGPMLREYIICEAMHALGILTTRSLAVVTTGERVPREYEDKGAILTRVASSHIRVGTFQYARNFGTQEGLKVLADYAIARHYPKVLKEANPYQSFYREVIKKQAHLIAQWQLIGFVHGVMNTDNMTISGETIDYGPCAFMDTYDVNTVFSSIDRHGRYTYGNQPRIAAWNLARLGEAMLPLFHEDVDVALKIANEKIEKFQEIYKEYMLDGMRKKLGLFQKEDQDENLIQSLLEIMQKEQMDYTNTFVDLTFRTLASEVYQTEEFLKWYRRYQDRLSFEKESLEKVEQRMKQSNPAVIPRNHRVEEALEAAIREEDYMVLNQLLNVLKNPYSHLPEQKDYASPNKEEACRYRTYCGT